MKPVTPNESMLRMRFVMLHDARDLGQNRDEGVRIGKRRWKRKRSKYLRQLNKREH
jgi:hypothetical protein